MLILPWFSEVGAKVVLLCLKAQAELYQCCSSSVSPAPAPPGTWSGAELCINGGNGGTGNPSVTLHTVLLSQAGEEVTKLWKRVVPCHAGACEVRSEHGAVAHRCPVGPVASLGYVCNLEKVTTCLIILKAVFTDSLF